MLCNISSNERDNRARRQDGQLQAVQQPTGNPASLRHLERGPGPGLRLQCQAQAGTTGSDRLPEPDLLHLGRKPTGRRAATGGRTRQPLCGQGRAVCPAQRAHEGHAGADALGPDRTTFGPGAGVVRAGGGQRQDAAQLRADPAQRGHRAQIPGLATQAAGAELVEQRQRIPAVASLGGQPAVAGGCGEDGSPQTQGSLACSVFRLADRQAGGYCGAAGADPFAADVFAAGPAHRYRRCRFSC